MNDNKPDSIQVIYDNETAFIAMNDNEPASIAMNDNTLFASTNNSVNFIHQATVNHLQHHYSCFLIQNFLL